MKTKSPRVVGRDDREFEAFRGRLWSALRQLGAGWHSINVILRDFKRALVWMEKKGLVLANPAGWAVKARDYKAEMATPIRQP